MEDSKRIPTPRLQLLNRQKVQFLSTSHPPPNQPRIYNRLHTHTAQIGKSWMLWTSLIFYLDPAVFYIFSFWFSDVLRIVQNRSSPVEMQSRNADLIWTNKESCSSEILFFTDPCPEFGCKLIFNLDPIIADQNLPTFLTSKRFFPPLSALEPGSSSSISIAAAIFDWTKMTAVCLWQFFLDWNLPGFSCALCSALLIWQNLDVDVHAKYFSLVCWKGWSLLKIVAKNLESSHSFKIGVTSTKLRLRAETAGGAQVKKQHGGSCGGRAEGWGNHKIHLWPQTWRRMLFWWPWKKWPCNADHFWCH